MLRPSAQHDNNSSLDHSSRLGRALFGFWVFISAWLLIGMVTSSAAQDLFASLFLAGSSLDSGSAGSAEFYQDPVAVLRYRHPQAVFQQVYDDLYREKKNDTLRTMACRYANALTMIAPLDSTLPGGTLAFQYNYSHLTARGRSRADRALHLARQQERFKVLYARNFCGLVKAGAGWQSISVDDTTCNHITAGLVCGPFWHVEAGYNFFTDQSGLDAALTIMDQYIEAPLDLTQQNHRLYLAIREFRGFSARVTYQYGILGDSAVAPAPSGYAHVPAGTVTGYGISGTWRLPRGLTCGFSCRAETLSGYSRLYYTGQKFGKLTSLQYSLRDYNGSIGYRLSPRQCCGVGYCRLQLDGFTSGIIESWPFSSALASLLGTRQYFNMTGTLTLDALQGSYACTADSALAGSAELVYLQGRPTGAGRSWQSYFLGLGMSNWEKYALTYTFFDGLVFRGALEYPLTRQARLKFGFTQFVPLSIKQKTTDTRPSGTTGGSSGHSTIDGGRQYLLNVLYFL
jgi:hypothetical protein